LPTTLGITTAPLLIVPESKAIDDEKLGGKYIAPTPPATLQGALSDVRNKTIPPPTPTFVPESQPNDDPLMGRNSTATTPPATLQGALSNVGSKTKTTNIIEPQSPAQSTADSSMPIKSTAYPSGSKLKEILAEKIKQAEKEIQSLQQAVKTQEALKPAVMNAQKPRSHNLNLTFIKNKALKERIIGKETDPDKTITESDGPDCGRGTYRQQDMNKRDNYMRSIGLKPLHNGRYLPPNPAFVNLPVPTFYVADSFGNDLVTPIRYSTVNQYTFVPASPQIDTIHTQPHTTKASQLDSKKDELASRGPG
jgi:hypothetical protein